jgi:hypothetical protein
VEYDINYYIVMFSTFQYNDMKVVAPKPVVKKVAESAEIKPWLASTANVPAEFRDKWTKLVRQDLNAATG